MTSVGAFGPGVSCLLPVAGPYQVGLRVFSPRQTWIRFAFRTSEITLDWMTRGMVFTPAAAALRRLRALLGFRATPRGTPSGVVGLPRDGRSRTSLYSGAL